MSIGYWFLSFPIFLYLASLRYASLVILCFPFFPFFSFLSAFHTNVCSFPFVLSSVLFSSSCSSSSYLPPCYRLYLQLTFLFSFPFSTSSVRLPFLSYLTYLFTSSNCPSLPILFPFPFSPHLPFLSARSLTPALPFLPFPSTPALPFLTRTEWDEVA